MGHGKPSKMPSRLLKKRLPQLLLPKMVTMRMKMTSMTRRSVMNSKSKNNLDLKMVGTYHKPHDGHTCNRHDSFGRRARNRAQLPLVGAFIYINKRGHLCWWCENGVSKHTGERAKEQRALANERKQPKYKGASLGECKIPSQP